MDTERLNKLVAASLLALSLMLGAGSIALAQVDADPIATETEPITTEVETDDGFDWGWLGLLGLIGLAGLRGGTRTEPTTTRRDTVHTNAETRPKR